MKNYTFSTTSSIDTNKTKTININTSSFLGEPNYSKILDDIIADNIIKNSPYLAGCLGKNTTPIATSCITIETPSLKKKSNAFLDALDSFIEKFIPSRGIKLDKGYTIKYNGHKITFYDDEIIIDDEIFSIDNIFSSEFFNALKPKTKKFILDIYTKAGNKISIDIAA